MITLVMKHLLLAYNWRKFLHQTIVAYPLCCCGGSLNVEYRVSRSHHRDHHHQDHHRDHHHRDHRHQDHHRDHHHRDHCHRLFWLETRYYTISATRCWEATIQPVPQSSGGSEKLVCVLANGSESHVDRVDCCRNRYIRFTILAVIRIEKSGSAFGFVC